MNNLFKCFTAVFLTLIAAYLSFSQAAYCQGAPKILRLSDAVIPGKSFIINGFGFTDDGTLKVALQKNNNGASLSAPTSKAVYPEIIQKDRNGNFMVAIMPAELSPGIYDVWIKNRTGWSLPKKLNVARALFISEREVFKGFSIKISGRNLDCREFDLKQHIAETKVRLNSNKTFFEMQVTAVNPYCVTFRISDEPRGKYFVEVSNDNGMNWGRLNNDQQLTILSKPQGGVTGYDPLGMGVSWAAHFNWKNIHRIPFSNGNKDVTKEVQAVVNKVAAQKGGGVVYFGNGVYKVSKILLQENIVLKGESKSGTILSYCGKDKDFITCTGSAITNGHIGIARMSIIVPPEVKDRPDVFINLGQAAIWQGVKNIHKRTASEMFVYDVKINYDFTETVKDRRGLPVSSIGNERLYIAHCDFKGFRMESHNYVSDYITVKNNYFEFAQGVFIYTGNYLFLENNYITGHTEINREKHGFMLRANAYVYNNTVAHTGSEEDPLNENWNDGEALCNETPGGNHNFGAIVSAARNTIIVGKTAGPFKDPEEEIYNHRSVMIIDGRGLGQYRRVAHIDTISKTVTLEKDWNLIPDSTSRFTLLEPNENITYYKNTIIDNPKGIWLFGNSIDCVAAENKSIDCDGIFIFSCMYTNDENPMYYFVPNYFNRITGNIIKGLSRKSHRAGIGLNSTREGSSNGAYFGVQQYANEIRNNFISGDALAQPLAQVTEAPAASGIFIYAATHSSLYDNKNIAGDATNHIVEDNTLENLSAGISLSRCIYGQVISNNKTDNTVRILCNDTMGSQNTIYR
ncbi:MAG TPA: glycosyl hydrolase family 28-related protein [Chitinophagaceae bacterium]|nr:glycosyl hydrolase family 28-related protein [Chitinophagaceae bacterium]